MDFFLSKINRNGPIIDINQPVGKLKTLNNDENGLIRPVKTVGRVAFCLSNHSSWSKLTLKQPGVVINV